MFKALISAGLNRGRLAQWIRLVIRMPELSEKHYERWSYVVRSGKLKKKLFIDARYLLLMLTGFYSYQVQQSSRDLFSFLRQ